MTVEPTSGSMPKRMLGLCATRRCRRWWKRLRRLRQTAPCPCDVLREGERRQVVELFNATEARYPKGKLLAGAVRGTGITDFGAVAVVYEEQSLTYGELNAQVRISWRGT